MSVLDLLKCSLIQSIMNGTKSNVIVLEKYFFGSGGSLLIGNLNHTSHEQSTRVPFGSLSGKGQEPLTITIIGAGDNHQSPLNGPRCSKLSRWQQPPRVTRESRSETRIPSVSRCKHSSNALGFTPNLTKMMNQ